MLLTASEIAIKLNEPVSRIRYILGKLLYTKDVEPIKKGNTLLYDKGTVKKVRKYIKESDRIK